MIKDSLEFTGALLICFIVPAAALTTAVWWIFGTFGIALAWEIDVLIFLCFLWIMCYLMLRVWLKHQMPFEDLDNYE